MNVEKALFALGDPCRLKILEKIRSEGSICCSDAMGITGLSQPTCSHHIKILSDAGLLNGKREGRNILFSLNGETFNAVRDYLQTFYGLGCPSPE